MQTRAPCHGRQAVAAAAAAIAAGVVGGGSEMTEEVGLTLGG